MRLKKDKIFDLNLDLNLNLILSMIIPYQNLYVYEISGAISDSKKFFNEDFIGCWNEGEASFLFFSQPHDEEVESFIEKKGYPLVSRNVLDYKAWQAGEELKPFKVGNLVISPPWENGKVEEGEILVHLDPCVVFGTGYHPTTRTCLEALWEFIKKRSRRKFWTLEQAQGSKPWLLQNGELKKCLLLTVMNWL